MDGYDYSMDEARLCLQNKREKRLQRMVHILIVVVLIQFFTGVILLVALGLRGKEPQHNHEDSQRSEINPTQEQRTDLDYPSIMLTAPNQNKTDGKYLLWESGIGHIHCHGGFIYSSGNLTVPRSGFYRIFLQITYSCSDNCEDVLLRPTVCYVSDAYDSDRSLLSAEERVSATGYWSKSLYTAGSYKLKANSILRVTSTHPELISRNEKLVFFGAYLLS